jgi:hypothetical protein
MLCLVSLTRTSASAFTYFGWKIPKDFAAWPEQDTSLRGTTASQRLLLLFRFFCQTVLTQKNKQWNHFGDLFLGSKWRKRCKKGRNKDAFV